MEKRTQARWALIAAVLAIAGLSSPGDGRACTVFCLDDQGRVVLGMNQDWMVPGAFLLINKRGVERAAMVDARPAVWTSRFGSVTFNQYGRDFPLGGMNEAGLVVQNLWLDGARYPDHDARRALGVLSWVQYQLDTAATVADVIASDERVRVDSPVPLHFFVADRRGEAAAIEFLGGRMVSHSGDDLPVAALTNSTYRQSLDAYRKDSGRRDTSSLGRFAIAAHRVALYSAAEDDPVEFAFETLRHARQPNTQWSEVYEIDRGRIHYRTRGEARTRSLDLEALDFSCSTPVLGIALRTDQFGNLEPLLRPFTAEQNLALIRASYRKTPFLADRTEADQRQAARHPETTRCVLPGMMPPVVPPPHSMR